MTLLHLYQEFIGGKITLNEYATALSTTPRNLKISLTKLGAKAPTYFAVLDQISRDEVSREQACSLLNVSPRAINAAMLHYKVARPLKEYAITREVSQIKWDIRRKYAIDYIGEWETLEDAAEKADVSPRQMRRWVSALIHEHYGIVFKDLKTIPLAKRRRLAQEIEQKEGLEYAEQQRVKAIAQGAKTLKDEAIELVMARRKRRAGTTKNV